MEFKLKYQAIFEAELIAEMESYGTIKAFKSGATLMDYGKYIRSIPLLLEGVIKIMRENEEGEELLLYFIEHGETCAMTLTCCLGKTKSEIRAIAEEDIDVMMVPVEKMDEWMVRFSSWRNFILNSYNRRMNELLNVIDLIAFNQMDVRIMNYLKEKGRISEDTFISKTHQEIANDLNTSRVVVSRILKKLEKEGIIQLHRYRIELM